ncbi:amidohydrolase family protein [Flavihumibacter profundi]|uniref:amidohydrolase family protein n=1 Tax=Flavihumibacter profundi TaxID=2716883 RepID=UPI001CC74DAC|nr:amidohydrolase family protein [Flavihumibacter profundi]MBZ5857356.1 amidohydrolase family protein [Flavihumibacter profundi]
MTKRLYRIIFALLFSSAAMSQENVYPAKEYKGLLFIKNANVHVGNGQVLDNVTIQVNNGKIEKIGKDLPIPMDDVKVFDVKGKQVYPGLILSGSLLGLVEVNSVRSTIDHTEMGYYNPSIRSIVAYNTDSKVINTLRSNGILLANIVPQGGRISGSSSVVQLDAWNYEDAAYKMDNGIHVNMPDLLSRPNAFSAPGENPIDKSLEEIAKLKAFFREAQAYAVEPTHLSTNLKYEAVKGLFSKSQKLFVHCNIVKEMLVAVDFAKEFGMDVVIVGGSESYQVAQLLKASNIAVILDQMHSLPTLQDDDVDQPYKTAAALQKAGVLFAINDEDGQTRGRNLPFNAGTAAAYGLTKEQALQAITLNAATILGIGDRTGSIEPGKDANIIVSEGDILDMRSSIVTLAFIQGRMIDLTDKHKQLYERYKLKYGIK